jgi:hypothetical protein
MVRLGGDQVAAHEQLVAFDGRMVVDRPAVFAGGFGGATVDTIRKTDWRLQPAWCCQGR